jgi:hypothetical protein
MLLIPKTKYYLVAFCLSGLKDQPGAALRDVPERLDVLQWSSLHIEFKWVGGSGLEELGNGGKNLLKRSAAEAAPQQFKPGTAQNGRVQANGGACHVPNLYIAHARRRGA